MSNEEKAKNYIISYFDLIKSVKDKISIISIIRKVLNELGYKEIVNNKTIIQTLTVNYLQDNGDCINSVHAAIECIGPRLDEYADSLYNTIYDYIKDNYEYRKENNKVILERKRLSINDSVAVKFTDSFINYIKYIIRRHKGGVYIIDNTIIYDFDTDTTKVISNEYNGVIHNFHDSDDRVLNCCSEHKTFEYDNDAKMIGTVVLKHEDSLDLTNINEYTVQDSDLENLFVSDNNYYSFMEIKKLSRDNASFYMNEKLEDGYFEYENSVPLTFDYELIDYFTGTKVEIGKEYDRFLNADTNNLEEIAFGRLLERLGLGLMEFDESFKNTLRDKFKEMFDDLFSCVYFFNYSKMIPSDLDEKKMKTKGYTKF